MLSFECCRCFAYVLVVRKLHGKIIKKLTTPLPNSYRRQKKSNDEKIKLIMKRASSKKLFEAIFQYLGYNLTEASTSLEI